MRTILESRRLLVKEPESATLVIFFFFFYLKANYLQSNRLKFQPIRSRAWCLWRVHIDKLYCFRWLGYKFVLTGDLGSKREFVYCIVSGGLTIIFYWLGTEDQRESVCVCAQCIVSMLVCAGASVCVCVCVCVRACVRGRARACLYALRIVSMD